jgi:hypothetical protein
MCVWTLLCVTPPALIYKTQPLFIEVLHNSALLSPLHTYAAMRVCLNFLAWLISHSTMFFSHNKLAWLFSKANKSFSLTDLIASLLFLRMHESLSQNTKWALAGLRKRRENEIHSLIFGPELVTPCILGRREYY